MGGRGRKRGQEGDKKKELYDRYDRYGGRGRAGGLSTSLKSTVYRLSSIFHLPFCYLFIFLQSQSKERDPRSCSSWSTACLSPLAVPSSTRRRISVITLRRRL